MFNCEKTSDGLSVYLSVSIFCWFNDGMINFCLGNGTSFWASSVIEEAFDVIRVIKSHTTLFSLSQFS